MKKENSILQLFPKQLRGYFAGVAKNHEDLSEIRIRVGKPVLIHRGKKEFYLSGNGEEKLASANIFENAICLDMGQVDSIFVHLCQYSPYAYGEELKQGFITVAGGHRIGVAGQVVGGREGISVLRNIRFLNIRISHEYKGAALPFLPYMYEGKNQLKSCLIIAPPGMGKTTMLRDLIRLISDGTKDHRGHHISVVDERSEIAGCFMGEPQNDVGIRTDVMDGCPKSHGMEMMLRSMAPEVIAVDEIALREDVETLLMLLHCGVKVLATIHGENMEDLKKKPYLNPLFEANYFQRYLLLKEKGKGQMFDEKGGRIL